MITLTKELIEKCASGGGTYTHRTIFILAGPAWFDSHGLPRHGWKHWCLGREITEEAYDAALAARSKRWHRQQNERQQPLLF